MSEIERQTLIAQLSAHREQVQLLRAQVAVFARSGERSALRTYVESQLLRRSIDVTLLESRLAWMPTAEP